MENHSVWVNSKLQDIIEYLQFPALNINMITLKLIFVKYYVLYIIEYQKLVYRAIKVYKQYIV